MRSRLRLLIALASVAILLLQGTIASAAALACMEACAKAASATCQPAKPSCHSEAGKADKGERHECDGACGSICSSDKSKAMPVDVTAFKVPSFEIAVVIPATDVRDIGIPDPAPELYETDSSPPLQTHDSPHSLRGPPSCRA